jgi:hypothetical protein
MDSSVDLPPTLLFGFLDKSSAQRPSQDELSAVRLPACKSGVFHPLLSSLMHEPKKGKWQHTRAS